MSKIIKGSLTLFTILVIAMTFTLTTFACSGGYGTKHSNTEVDTFLFIIADDMPRMLTINCTVNFEQYAMVAGNAIGFHEAWVVAIAKPSQTIDSVDVSAYSVDYYKGSTHLQRFFLSNCPAQLILNPDWYCTSKCGDANVVNQATGTYIAKATVGFTAEGSISAYSIDNSISVSVN